MSQDKKNQLKKNMKTTPESTRINLIKSKPK
jgi:hypothetical protein